MFAYWKREWIDFYEFCRLQKYTWKNMYICILTILIFKPTIIWVQFIIVYKHVISSLLCIIDWCGRPSALLKMVIKCCVHHVCIRHSRKEMMMMMISEIYGNFCINIRKIKKKLSFDFGLFNWTEIIVFVFEHKLYYDEGNII